MTLEGKVLHFTERLLRMYSVPISLKDDFAEALADIVKLACAE